MFKIYQRRYLGNKAKVLDLIEDVIRKNIGHFTSFCDIFARTESVGTFLMIKIKNNF